MGGGETKDKVDWRMLQNTEKREESSFTSPFFHLVYSLNYLKCFISLDSIRLSSLCFLTPTSPPSLSFDDWWESEGWGDGCWWFCSTAENWKTFFFTIIEFPQLQLVDYILIVTRWLCLLSFSVLSSLAAASSRSHPASFHDFHRHPSTMGKGKEGAKRVLFLRQKHCVHCFDDENER